METIDLINGLTDAHLILHTAKQKLASGPLPLWRIVDHALTHVEKQITDLLAPDPEPVPTLDLNARLRASIKLVGEETPCA